MKKNFYKLRWWVFFLLFTISFTLYAQDFGALIDQSVVFTAHREDMVDKRLDYSGSFIPYFSTLLGDIGELNVAAAFTYRVNPWYYVPELLMTELILRFDKSEIKLGRMEYNDPLGLIAGGYFDGAMISLETNGGTISAGGWYTGYLFKTRAAITMTKEEEEYCYERYSFEDFIDTYFAPARAFSVLSWENPSFGGFMNISLSLLGQFDFTGADLYSQYVILNLSIPSEHLIFDLGGCFELIQYNSIYNGMRDSTMAVAAKAGLTLILPGMIEQRISLHGIYSSGVYKNISISAFLPLTTTPQGNLLNAKLTGLSIFSLNINSKFSETVFTDLSVSCFMRNDLETYKGYPVFVTNSKGYFLGPEFYWKLSLNTASGFQMNLGGGAFIPELGNADLDANILWKAEASILFSLF